MAKLSINLLPPELEVEKKQKQRFSYTVRFSTLFLVIMVGLAAVVLSLRLSQNVVLSNVNRDLDKAKITLNSPDYNQREGLVITLKNRLDSIGSLLSQDTYGSYAFNLISGLMPQGISINSFSTDNKGKASLTVETSDINALQTFLDQLVNPNTNQKKISLVHVENISLGKSRLYQTDITLTLVGGSVKK